MKEEEARVEAAEREATRALDQEKKTPDLRKLRVTALPTCTRISFPETDKKEETKTQTQKELILNTIQKYKKENKLKSGNNLTLEEEMGYR